jgi:hypothetical protein
MVLALAVKNSRTSKNIMNHAAPWAPCLGRWLFAVALFSFHSLASADSFTDNFANGLNSTNWLICSNQPLFSSAVTGGYVEFSKPEGGTSGLGLQYEALASKLVAQGDFDVQVQFTNASIAIQSGSPGNQIQLDVRFGGQDFLVVRSDEQAPGQNAHVYLNPPGNVTEGTTGWNNNYGTLRVVRTGTEVQGYIDSTLLYEGAYNTNDATFVCALQNNGTEDPIAVWFFDFQLTAGNIVPLSPDPQIRAAAPSNCVISWHDQSWPDILQGYTLQSTATLAAPIVWQPNTPSVAGNDYWFTNPISGPALFFRVKQGP